MNSTEIAVDVAKSVFEIAVSEAPGRVTERHRLSRPKFRRFIEQREASHFLLEACGTAHYWGRELEALGHRVSLLHGGDVARYRDGNKTDRADAKALLEASRNEDLDPVPVKTPEQQAIAALHRLRQGCMRTRTARINAVRGHLREFGVVIPLGSRRVVAAATDALSHPLLPVYLVRALEEAIAEIQELEARAGRLRLELEALATHSPSARLLMTVPGVGVLTATALVAFVGDIHRFASGRAFATYLGLTPSEHSTGHSKRLGRITKRGNRYLRTLLVHGARSALLAARRSSTPDDLGTWALSVHERRGHNIATVALANKLARVCWRVWHDQRPFQRREAAL